MMNSACQWFAIFPCKTNVIMEHPADWLCLFCSRSSSSSKVDAIQGILLLSHAQTKQKPQQQFAKEAVSPYIAKPTSHRLQRELSHRGSSNQNMPAPDASGDRMHTAYKDDEFGRLSSYRQITAAQEYGPKIVKLSQSSFLVLHGLIT